MIQAEIGGGARVNLGTGIQRPGFMIRDFALKSSRGEEFRISSLRGRFNLLVVFMGESGAMRAFLEGLALREKDLPAQEACAVIVLPRGPEEQGIADAGNSAIVILYDEKLTAYRLSGAVDENGLPRPLIYLTDRFGEIVATYAAADDFTHPDGNFMPPAMDEILNKLEFANQQCPECEPPEWPR